MQIVSYRERITFFGTETERYVTYDSTTFVYLKKVADQPYELIDLMRDCIARDKSKTDTLVKKVTPSKESLPGVVKIITPEKPKDSSALVITAPVNIKTDSASLPKPMKQRKNKEQKRIVVDVKTINLKVYDNAIMDGDTVSILYNGKMLLTHQLLSEKGVELTIELDEKQSRHEITLFAENLGSIPPNTALIVVTAGTKRYELFASASLEENAVLVFDYKPK
jgi:myo-inositol-hexaphosphate 3-phosphohydrolase